MRTSLRNGSLRRHLSVLQFDLFLFRHVDNNRTGCLENFEGVPPPRPDRRMIYDTKGRQFYYFLKSSGGSQVPFDHASSCVAVAMEGCCAELQLAANVRRRNTALAGCFAAKFREAGRQGGQGEDRDGQNARLRLKYEA